MNRRAAFRAFGHEPPGRSKTGLTTRWFIGTGSQARRNRPGFRDKLSPANRNAKAGTLVTTHVVFQCQLLSLRTKRYGTGVPPINRSVGRTVSRVTNFWMISVAFVIIAGIVSAYSAFANQASLTPPVIRNSHRRQSTLCHSSPSRRQRRRCSMQCFCSSTIFCSPTRVSGEWENVRPHGWSTSRQAEDIPRISRDAAQVLETRQRSHRTNAPRVGFRCSLAARHR